jgi:hypothetical protein
MNTFDTNISIVQKRFFFGAGTVVLLLMLFLLHTWLVLFFTYAVQLPEAGVYACWGTGCERTAWQVDVSRYFAFQPWARVTPFLYVFHITLFISLFRIKRKAARTFLPLEIGLLILIWILAGTAVFGLVNVGYGVYQANAGAQPAEPIPLEGGAFLLPGKPAPVTGGFVIEDAYGFVELNPADDLVGIYQRIPWNVNSRMRAWAGGIASAVMVLGLLLSIATGWLNRLIRRVPLTGQTSLLFLALLATCLCIFAEISLFGFYIFS